MNNIKRARIAYLLLVHNKPDQLNVYIRQLLSMGDCDIFIHVSKRNPEMIPRIMKDEHVHVFSEYEVKWASFEIIASCIFLMEQAVNTKKEYDFIHFGSGQDLVVKRGLLEFLANHPNDVFIQVDNLVDEKSIASSLYRIIWPRFLMVPQNRHPYRVIRGIISRLYLMGLYVRKNPYDLPEGWGVYIGETWFTFPFHVVEYILDFLDKTPDYAKFWSKTLVPDLLFFHTIVMNSEFKDEVTDQLTFVQFGEERSNRNHPITITLNEVSKIEDSGKYFARKFDENVNRDAITYFFNKIQMD